MSIEVGKWAERSVNEKDLIYFATKEDQRRYSKEIKFLYLERIFTITFVALGCIALIIAAFTLTLNLTSISLPLGLNCFSTIPLYGSSILIVGGLSVIGTVILLRALSTTERKFKEFQQKFFDVTRSNFIEWGKSAVYEGITPKETTRSLYFYTHDYEFLYKISPTIENLILKVGDPTFTKFNKDTHKSKHNFKKIGGKRMSSLFLLNAGTSVFFAKRSLQSEEY